MARAAAAFPAVNAGTYQLLPLLLQGTGTSRPHLTGHLTTALPPTFPRSRSLANNQLNGSLPAAWSSMGRLLSLDLSGNALSGPLPAPWSRQRGLVRLGLARNAFTGGLPREWSAFTTLLTLDLAGNNLSGRQAAAGCRAGWGPVQAAEHMPRLLSRHPAVGSPHFSLPTILPHHLHPHAAFRLSGARCRRPPPSTCPATRWPARCRRPGAAWPACRCCRCRATSCRG